MALEFVWQDGERVLFINDEATESPEGFTRLVPGMITARYPERNIAYDPRPVGGDRLPEVLGRLDRDILREPLPPPSRIIVALGLNDARDVATGTPLGRFRDLYHELMTRLRDTGAIVMACTTTVLSEELDSEDNQRLVGYNDAIREIAFAHQAQVVDVNAVFREAIHRAKARNPDFRYTVDGVHLDVYGHYLLALTLLGALHFTP